MNGLSEEVFARRLTSGVSALGVALDRRQVGRLYACYAELERWNRKINLVSRRHVDWLRAHFVDSAAAAGMDLLHRGARMVDLGAGAGFPGLVLKVVRPDISLSMAEASGRKCAWLRHIARHLELENTQVLEGRFEDLLAAGWAGSFDLAVSRAAAKPASLTAAAAPFLAEEGRLLIYTTEPLTEPHRGRLHHYRVPGSKVPSVIWELRRDEIAQ